MAVQRDAAVAIVVVNDGSGTRARNWGKAARAPADSKKDTPSSSGLMGAPAASPGLSDQADTGRLFLRV